MYEIITELGRMFGSFETVEDAVEHGKQNLPDYLNWEVRDEEQDVFFTHYVDHE